MAMRNIGRYQITREIGKGAMGVVYEAIDPNIGRAVALKTTRLDVHGAEAQELLARFRNEAHAAGVLNHPNIVTIYDAGEHDGMYYIAMEYIAGTTLESRMRSQRVLPVPEVIEYARQICAALDYAHGKGVIHRDIKPANIMIAGDVVKIMDFGVAKAGAALTSTGLIVGTPNYMSPEQVRGQSLDGCSDLFSLGVMLYEMMTGKRPFIGEGVTTVIYKIVNETPLPLINLNAKLHPGLSAIIAKTLAKAPEQRFASGADLVKALENYQDWKPEPAAALVMNPAAARVAAGPGATQPLQPSAVPRPGGSPAVPPARLKPAAAAAKPIAPKPAPPPMARRSPPPSPPTHRIVSVAVVAMAFILISFAGIRLLKRPGSTALLPPEPPAPVVPADALAEEPPSLPPSSLQRPESKPAPARPRIEARKSEPPAPAGGRLRLTSSPAGAAVQIDGAANPAWVTPFTTPPLKPGPHTVVFSRAGYQPQTKPMAVTPDTNQAVNADLAPEPAFFSVNSDPEGALILLDGSDTGQKTPAKLSADPGPHRIVLRKDGFRPERMMMEVSPGQTLYFAPKLTPQETPVSIQEPVNADYPQPGGRSPFGRFRWLFGGGQGAVAIRTLPRGAQISIEGGGQLQMRTPARFPMNPGRYQITLTLPGYRPISRQVDITKGQVFELNEVFQRE